MIETPRLILRGWKESDIEPWVLMNLDARVMEFFPRPTPRERSIEQAAIMQKGIEENGYGWWVVELKATGEFAGITALDDVTYPVPFTPTREVGWRFRAEMWGRGYATEAALAALDFARERLGWDSIVSFTAVTNVRSQRVMQRLGMTHDPAEDFDHPRIEDGHPLRRHVLYRKTLR